MDLYGTLGPSCAGYETLRRMFSAGMTGLRLNLSHIGLTQSRELLEEAKRAARDCGVVPQLLMDLQGPELRVGAEGLPCVLETGEIRPLIDLCLPEELLCQIAPGQQLLLDDGKLCAEVLEGKTCRILRGGTLLPRKSVAAPGLALELPALTKQDRENLRLSAEMGVTGVMQSFVRSRSDLVELRRAMAEEGAQHLRVFAKVENQEGMRTLPEWSDLADRIVIARGDLGNSMPIWQLPVAQKIIAEFCMMKQKPFLVVTQILASMEHCAVPTRAEVNDIFNNVLDGASALMLTGETAAGDYPVEAMEMLCRTADEALRYYRMKEEQTDGLY